MKNRSQRKADFPLSEKQEAAVDTILANLEEHQTAILYGYAGTGKTTTITHPNGIAYQFSCPLFVAPTNRAAKQMKDLMDKLKIGFPVSTIHAAAYGKPVETYSHRIGFVQECLKQAGASIDGSFRKPTDAMLVENEYREHEYRENEDMLSPKEYGEKFKEQADIIYNHENKEAKVNNLSIWLVDLENRNKLGFVLEDQDSKIAPDLIVVDEVSMLTSEMDKRLNEVFDGVPILYVGDPFQLPPVIDREGQNKGIKPFTDYADKELSVTLNHVERTAEGKLLRFCNWLRDQESIRTRNFIGHEKFTGDKTLNIIDRHSYGIENGLAREANMFDIIICRTNRTRYKLNRIIRDIRFSGQFGKIHELPVPGDMLVCDSAPSFKAQKEVNPENLPDGIFIVKGDILQVVHCDIIENWRGYKSLNLTLVFPGEDPDKDAFLVRSSSAELFFNNYYEYKEVKRITCEDLWKWRNRRNLCFDYAYAITAHKSQGGEYGSVFVYEERPPGEKQADGSWKPADPVEHVRWLYTAVTRAKETCTISAA